MTTDPAAAPAPMTPIDPATSPAAPAAAAVTAQAVEHLFRYASRAGRLHPLQHLLQRYRAGERA